MDTDPALRNVIVGLDGSEAALAALRWASAVTEPAGQIVALHAAPGDPSTQRESLERWIGEGSSHDRPVTAVVSDGDPADGLLATAREYDADLVVIGVHEQRRTTLRRLGPVAHRLLTATDRPVAIVGARWDQRIGEAGSPVVAGVGFGAATAAALRWAAGFAEREGTGLKLIRAISKRPMFRPDGLLDAMAYYIDPELRRAWALEDIQAVADEIQHSTDDELAISWSIPSRSKRVALVEASTDAAVLVVGLHGSPDDAHRDDAADSEHEVASWLRHALLHAPCPVVIVPPD